MGKTTTSKAAAALVAKTSNKIAKVAARSPVEARTATKRPVNRAGKLTRLVSARIDADIKAEAERVLAAIGIDASTAIRVLMARIAVDKQLPFELHRPSKRLLASLREAAKGEVKSFGSVAALMADLDADD